MESINLTDIVEALNIIHEIKGILQRKISNVKSIEEANESSLIWISSLNPEKQILAEKTSAHVIVCDNSIKVESLLRDKTFIIVEKPRLAFIRIVQKFFTPKPKKEIHQTALIHPEANIDEDCYIGPFSYIGKSKLGKDCQIMGHVFIYDGVEIGDRVIIHAGAVIGADGFGFQRNDLGELEKFPHIGGVVIEDDVEIGANTCIDRGTLGNTIIKKGTKIDNLVHVAHNVIIGENVVVIANAMIGGSTQISNQAWIAPSACLRDGLFIGERSIIGLGSVVVKNVGANSIVFGSPAKQKN